MSIDTVDHVDLTGSADIHTAAAYIQSGDPGAVGAGKIWYDIDDDKVYMRNDTDTGWTELTGGGGAHPDLATHEALGLVTDTDLANHVSAGDPHTDYRLESVQLVTADYTDDNVTYAKIQNVSATDRILGRDTAGAGNIEELTIQQVLGMRRGSAFPGGPATNDEFYRTDLGADFVYDGTRWVTRQVFQSISSMQSALFPFSATNLNSPRGSLMVPSGYSDAWLISYDVTFFIAGGGSALSGSHKWVIDVYSIPNNDTLWTTNIDSGSSSVWRKDSGNIGALHGSTDFAFETDSTKTGTPGNLTFGVVIRYRLVAT